MRARNREVNIFNMSLLDILTGMLGAFLFLMLGLVPYYTKAKNSGNGSGSGNGDKEPSVDTVLNVTAQWGTAAKLDFFIRAPDGTWKGYNDKSVPLSKRTKIVNNSTSAAAGWATAASYAEAGQHYLVAYSLQAPTDPQSMRTIYLTFELFEAQIKPDGSALSGFYPDMVCTAADASGAKPGQVYALYWIDVTKDTTKEKYYRQYDYACYAPSKFPLPPGVVPSPPAAPVTPIVAPTTSNDIGPLGFPNFHGTTTPPATNSVPPPRNSPFPRNNTNTLTHPR